MHNMLPLPETFTAPFPVVGFKVDASLPVAIRTIPVSFDVADEALPSPSATRRFVLNDMGAMMGPGMMGGGPMMGSPMMGMMRLSVDPASVRAGTVSLLLRNIGTRDHEVVVLPRGEVETMQLGQQSMMPDDLLKPLSALEVRSLIAYLASPSQVPMLATAAHSAERAAPTGGGDELKGRRGGFFRCIEIKEKRIYIFFIYIL
jgi:hypothetical protein